MHTSDDGAMGGYDFMAENMAGPQHVSLTKGTDVHHRRRLGAREDKLCIQQSNGSIPPPWGSS